MEEIRKTVSILCRCGSQLRAILALQPVLHKMPQKRPSSIAGRTEFTDALAYLRLMSETRRENHAALEWWDAFLLATPLPVPEEQSTDEIPKRKRRRRRRNRRTLQSDSSGQLQHHHQDSKSVI